MADLVSSYLLYVAAGIILVLFSIGLQGLLKESLANPMLTLEAALYIPYAGLLSLTGNGSRLVPSIGVSLLSTLSTSAIFATYNLVSLLGSSVHVSRTRLMSAFENLFESKALFTTIGGIASAIILVAKAVVHLIVG